MSLEQLTKMFEQRRIEYQEVCRAERESREALRASLEKGRKAWADKQRAKTRRALMKWSVIPALLILAIVAFAMM